MRILHTSDWHLGKKLEEFSRLEEQREILDEICHIADREDVDAVVIAGDLFDTFNPPTEAVELFYKTLKRISKNGHRAVIAITGNHDSPDRIESPDPLARECGILFIGYPHTVVAPFELDSGLRVLRSEPGFLELQLPGHKAPLRVLHTAYANELRIRTYLGTDNPEAQMRELLERQWRQLATQYCDNKGVNILTGHLFIIQEGSEIPEEPEEEKPILHVGGTQAVYSGNLPQHIQYAAFGHLHRKQQVSNQPCPVCYSGSPIAYSFAEAGQKKYLLLAEIEPGQKASVREIELTKGKTLLRRRSESIEDALLWLEIHKESLVELTLVTDNFLTAADRKRLCNVHPGIVTIIPELRNKEILQGSASSVDLSRSMEELFCDFFTHEKGQPPDERIINLFREVVAKPESNE